MTTPSLFVLIPESTRKAKGGDPDLKADDTILEGLPQSFRAALLRLRDQVRQAWSPGRDATALMPAYKRFQGNMYRRIPEEAWERRVPSVEVLMVSGLYGFVASRDNLPYYPHSMAESVKPFGKLNRWWHDRGLPGILETYLKSARASTVVDLLSLEYRKAVEGYSEGLPLEAVKTINFPGLGRASQPRRGEIVAQILESGRFDTVEGKGRSRP